MSRVSRTAYYCKIKKLYTLIRISGGCKDNIRMPRENSPLDYKTQEDYAGICPDGQIKFAKEKEME